MESKSKELLETIKRQAIDQVFQNEEISLEEKIAFCQELESFGESWRSLIFTQELEKKKEREENDSAMKKLKANLA